MLTLRVILRIPSSVEENLIKPKSLAIHNIVIVAIICKIICKLKISSNQEVLKFIINLKYLTDSKKLIGGKPIKKSIYSFKMDPNKSLKIFSKLGKEIKKIAHP